MKKLLIIICLFSQVFFLACINRELANVGGISVTESDVDYRIKNIDQNLIKNLGEDKMKEMILQGIIEESLVYLDLRDKGYEKDEKRQAEWMQNVRGLSVHYFLNTFLLEEYPVSKDDLKAEYQKNRASFKKDEKVKVAHILVRTGGEFLDDKSALKKITEISSKLKEDGSNFNDLATEYSDCPSGKDGGDLGFIGKEEMLPEFEAVVFNMKSGEVKREPVKTKFGYHLVKVSEKEDDKYMEIDEVKDYLSNIINIRKLKDEYKPESFPEKLNNASAETVVGKTSKSGISYKYSDLLADIKIFMGPVGIDKVKKDMNFAGRVIDEMIFARVMEDKMNELGMSKNSNYSDFIKLREKEFYINSFIKDYIGSQIKIDNNEIRKEVLTKGAEYRKKYGESFVKDSALKNEVDKVVAQDIENNKRSELFEVKYKAYIEELKKKYTIAIQ